MCTSVYLPTNIVSHFVYTRGGSTHILQGGRKLQCNWPPLSWHFQIPLFYALTGGTLPYLKVVGKFSVIDLLFWDFQIPLIPTLCLKMGGILSYINIVVTFCSDDPLFYIFHPFGFIFYVWTQTHWLLLSTKNHFVSFIFIARDN